MRDDRRRLTVAEINDWLSLRIVDLAGLLVPDGRREGREWRAGRRGSFCVYLDGRRRGKWRDFEAGEGGDPIGLIKRQMNLEVKDAIGWAKDFLGFTEAPPSKPPPARPDPHPANDEDLVNKIQLARDFWSRGEAYIGSPAQEYMRGRGVHLAEHQTYALRFYPQMKHRATGRYHPCLIAGVKQLDGELTGIWRIYLQKRAGGGFEKLAVQPNKMGLGLIAGGAVRFAAADRLLYVAEGLETTGSFAAINPGIAAWAALSTGHMQALRLPGIVEELVILTDADYAGFRAARRTMARLDNHRRTVRIQGPTEGWNDINDMVRPFNDFVEDVD